MEQQRKSSKNIRLEAARALHEIYVEKGYANIVLQRYIEQGQFSEMDRRFFTEVVYGVLRHHYYLESCIRHFTKKPVKKLSAWIAMILRLGCYQILCMDKVPPQAAVDESVKLAKKLARGLAPFVNGVLRNVVREKSTLTPSLLSHSEEERLSLTYNQPQWLLKRWLSTYTKDEVEALCSYFNEVPVLQGRFNTVKGTLTEGQSVLSDAGIHWQKSVYFPEGLTIEKHSGSLKKASWVKEGWISFMDAGSLGIAHLLDPQPGERVLDVCAAPGSKSYHMAALMQNQGYIKACDIHPHKIELLKEGAKRLGVSIVDPVLQDATIGCTADIEAFDRVLVDAPCSGLGILQKKLDMRWRKTEEELAVFPPLQLEILEKAASALKNGGVLVYSTCTLHRQENEGVVHAFLQRHPEFSLEEGDADFPFPLTNGMITLWPPKYHTDGFFMARLRKTGQASEEKL